MTRVLALIALLGCHRDNYIELQFGPNSESIGNGFSCNDPDNDAGVSIFGRAYSGGMLRFTLVVDIMTIAGVTPGCGTIDIVEACKSTGVTCTLVQRACTEVSVSGGADPGSSLEQLVLDALHDKMNPLFTSVPSGTAIVRAVAISDTSVTCDSDPNSGSIIFGSNNVLGCEYSCAEVLNDVSGPLELQFDAFGLAQNAASCDSAILQCARYKPQ